MGKFQVPDHVLYVCTGSKCAKRGGKEMYKAAKGLLKYSRHNGEVEIIRTDCTDNCDYAPVCAIQPGNLWLKEYRVKQVLLMMEELASKG
jgi:NADH:ubiquinone oxidoreductase subunit E